MTEVAYRLLGPLQVVVDGHDVTPSAPKERALLALLLLDRNRVVGADRLMEELWPDLAPDKARRVLQVRVGALRKLLHATGARMLEFAAPGYRLAAAAEDIDEHLFFLLVTEAQRQVERGNPAGAAATLRRALAMWRGEPLADVQVCLTLEAEAARLDEARLSATEELVDAELACGHHEALLADLEVLVAVHPLSERLWSQKVLALYRCGRQAEALRACHELRQRLVDQLGIEPGPAQRHLETAVLEQRPELDLSSSSGTGRYRIGDRTVWSDEPPIPAVHYATAEDGVRIAYQVAGDGPLDVIVVPGFVSHLETWWEAFSGRLVRRLASSARLILFDKRGTGLSDRPTHLEVEQWVEDVAVVLDAVGSQRAAILGVSAGGAIAMLFAAAYPERTQALVLYGGFARILEADDYPIGATRATLELINKATQSTWGLTDIVDERDGPNVGLDFYCPSISDDPAARELFARFQRISASPTAAGRYAQMMCQVDARHVCPMIAAPTLVLHPSRDGCVPIEHGRYIADRIPGAVLVELDSADHLIWFSDAIDELTGEIHGFLSGCASGSRLPARGGL